MKQKGGNVYGSIYERKRKNGGISYTAEIQFHGQVMRRSSKNRDALQVWTDIPRGGFLFRVVVLAKPHQPPFPHVSRFLGRGGFCQDAKPRHSWHNIKTPTCIC